MSIELLREISAGELPLAVTAEADIDKLRVLHAAQMVEARFSLKAGEAATALSLTGFGVATLRAFNARQILDRQRKVLAATQPLSSRRRRTVEEPGVPAAAFGLRWAP